MWILPFINYRIFGGSKLCLIVKHWKKLDLAKRIERRHLAVTNCIQTNIGICNVNKCKQILLFLPSGVPHQTQTQNYICQVLVATITLRNLEMRWGDNANARSGRSPQSLHIPLAFYKFY